MYIIHTGTQVLWPNTLVLWQNGIVFHVMMKAVGLHSLLVTRTKIRDISFGYITTSSFFPPNWFTFKSFINMYFPLRWRNCHSRICLFFNIIIFGIGRPGFFAGIVRASKPQVWTANSYDAPVVRQGD